MATINAANTAIAPRRRRNFERQVARTEIEDEADINTSSTGTVELMEPALLTQNEKHHG
jgi:hypothetical protein